MALAVPQNILHNNDRVVQAQKANWEACMPVYIILEHHCHQPEEETIKTVSSINNIKYPQTENVLIFSSKLNKISVVKTQLL